MNANEIAQRIQEQERKTALDLLAEKQEASLVPEMYWRCEKGHEFGEGLYRDPGRCPQCLSHYIKAVYP